MIGSRSSLVTMRRLISRALILLLTFGLTLGVSARLGGGGGYSGGGGGGYSGGGGGYSSSGGSYSGGGGGEITPGQGWFIFVVAVFLIAVNLYGKIKEQESTVIARPPILPPDWDALRRYDANFSEVLFRDFAYSLFSKIHEARGSNRLLQYRQFLSDKAMKELEEMGSYTEDVYGVVVGALNVRIWKRPLEEEDNIVVKLSFDANYTEVIRSQNRPQAVYTYQVWYLSRKANVLSPALDKITAFDCVGCGSAYEPAESGECKHCGKIYDPGEHHWKVDSVSELNRKIVGPALTSKAADVGLNLSTVYDPNLEGQRAQFIKTYPDMDFGVAIARFQHIYHTLQKSWSEQDLDQLRPFETDSLFQNHRYWVEEYQRQNLRNVLKEVALDNIEMVKIRSDKFYDAITCRLFSSMIDYTQDENGKVLCGSTSRSTRFSEYWTFVRGRGAAENTKGDAVCPNCAAELKISMAGECEYCGSKLTSGQFDWVLSEIQQDEEYAG